MNLDKIITQLRLYCPLLGTRVAGAGNQLEGVSTTSNLGLPAGYVYPLGSTAGEALGMGASLKQIVTEHIGLCVIFDNSEDRRGQSSADQITPMREALLRALYNYRPDTTHASRALYYIGDKDVSMDRGRLQWEFEFCLDVTISYMDGFIVPLTPLTEIDMYNTGRGGGEMTVQKVIP
jgi:hypothetical protein